jgi:hypothetical protein
MSWEHVLGASDSGGKPDRTSTQSTGDRNQSYSRCTTWRETPHAGRDRVRAGNLDSKSACFFDPQLISDVLLNSLIYLMYFDAIILGRGSTMKWQKERDDLIAQTKAFVQSVTGRTPQAVLGPIFNKAAATENPFAAPAADPVSPPPLPLEPIVAAKPTETTPIEQLQPIDLPPVKPLVQGDVRKEIQTRVAAFQAHQHRFHRERDAYYNSVLTRARSGIEDGSDAPSS